MRIACEKQCSRSFPRKKKKNLETSTLLIQLRFCHSPFSFLNNAIVHFGSFKRLKPASVRNPVRTKTIQSFSLSSTPLCILAPPFWRRPSCFLFPFVLCSHPWTAQTTIRRAVSTTNTWGAPSPTGNGNLDNHNGLFITLLF